MSIYTMTCSSNKSCRFFFLEYSSVEVVHYLVEYIYEKTLKTR